MARVEFVIFILHEFMGIWLQVLASKLKVYRWVGAKLST